MRLREMAKDIVLPAGAVPEVKHYVSGRWVAGAGTETSEIRDPATGEIIAVCRDARPDQIEEAFRAAHAAQEEWHFNVQEQEKDAVFRRVVHHLEAFKGQLAWTIIREGGKLWKWADGEVQEAIDTIWHYHGELSRVEGVFSRCQMPRKVSLTVRDPYGVILGITPWNFPLAVPCWKIFGALAGGNAIVVKDAEQTPMTMSMAVWCINRAVGDVLGEERAAKLAGLVGLIHGKGETVGKFMLEKGDYDKVAFTGGTETGVVVASVSAKRGKPTPCHLELGGHAAMVVMPDFDVDRAVSEALTANCGDTGQRCVSLRVAFVHEASYQKFLWRYIERAQKLRIGRPDDFATQVGPLASREQLERVAAMVNRTESQLGRTRRLGVRGGGDWDHFNIDPEARHGGSCYGGYYYPPTVFDDVHYGTLAMDKEIFGPVLCVAPFHGRDMEQALKNGIELMNRSAYGLSNSVCTKDISLAMEAVLRAKTGILYINRGTTGAELNRYFGGVKGSGWGREGRGIDDFTQVKQVYIDTASQPRMAQAGSEDAAKQLLAASAAEMRDLWEPTS